MFTVYILQGVKHGRYYIGHTSNLENRLKYHNGGRVKFTRNYRPWKVIYTDKYNTKSEAYRHELEIKNFKGEIKLKS